MISDYREKINAELESFFNALPDKLGLDLSKDSLIALTMLQEYCLRPGKRIRGSLAAFSYDYAAGDHFGASGLRLAVAFELIQSYFLIIDDVMDKSATRRGKPTIHELYGQSSTTWAHDQHTTNMLAINVGLIAQHLANIAIAELPEKPELITKLFSQLHRNIAGTTFGQIDDLVQQIGEDVNEQDIMRKYLLKSSYYTYISPLQSGLTLAGVTDQKTLQEVREFGDAAGVAFQLHDDYLGVFGEAAKTGKSNLDDLQEGKYTLLIQHALEHTDQQGKTLLLESVGNNELTENQAVAVRQVLSESGAKSYLQQQTKDYASQATAIIQASSYWNEESKRVLEELVTFTVSRES